MASPLSRPVLPGLIPHPIHRGAAYLCNKIGSLTQGAAIAVARPAILSLLSSIEIGTLTLVDEPDGELYVFGQPPETENEDDEANTIPTLSKPPDVTLTVTSPTFYLRVLLRSDMGFAESYLLHEVTCADLTSFFRLIILNRARLLNNGTTATIWKWPSFAGRTLATLSQLLLLLLLLLLPGLLALSPSAKHKPQNTTDGAALNAAAHYDISNDMFAAFLSPDMTYSCPVWACRGAELLEDAQTRKLARFVEGARIKASDHVLEIGTGWGSFAIEAVKRTGCRVTTLTLSRAQKVWAEERIAREGLAGRIEVLLMDYRALPVPERKYDKVVSIEMVEAVGREFLGTYFARVDQLLKRDGGIAMFQCITMPESRHEAYSRSEDFVNRYIFPGGYLPSTTQLLNHIAIQSKGTLLVEKVENIGGHYARTLRLWKLRFLVNFESQIRPALLKEHPNMTQDEIDLFRRKWEYYFAYCEAGFLTKTLGDVIITVSRESAIELMEGIPL